MNNASKTNLRKLSFLGFGRSSAPNLNDGTQDSEATEVYLDEECAKVFAMGTTESERFDFANFHDTYDANLPRQYGEKDYSLHRKKSYPYIPAPLKSSKNRRITSTQPTPSLTPTGTPLEAPGSPSSTVGGSSSLTHTPSSVRSPIFRDSERAPISSTLTLTLHEEDTGGASSESDCLFSDPASYKSPQEISPERKVQFVPGSNSESDGPAAHKDKKHKKLRHHYYSKPRKFSFNPEDERKNAAKIENRGLRRISTQPEDLPLRGADREQLDSHRSDDPRTFRRHRSTRPSIVHIGRKDGTEQIYSVFTKKSFDHSPHAIFVQLDELFDGHEDREWKETARWIKYEEDVEEGVDRWGKPHVASLSFHSLLNLRKCLEDGLVILDLEERDLASIAYRISEDLYKEDLIREEDKSKIMRILLLRHRHVNDHHERGFRFPRKHSYASLQNLQDVEKRKSSFCVDPFHGVRNGVHLVDTDGRVVIPENQTVVDMKEETYTTSNEDIKKAQNDTILRRIPAGAQGTSVLVGDVDFLEQPAIAFIRLAEGVIIPSLVEVTIPVRFIFLLLGPKGANLDYHEVGRSISTLMANQHFHNIAYEADNRRALLSAINEFLDDSIVLPPGDWERQALLPIEELKAKNEAIRRRKENALKKSSGEEVAKALLTSGDDKKPPFPNPLERTRRPFGGLINDIRRRFPHYKSDLIDGLSAQCFAAAIFMYFAAISAAITFGGLMQDKTNNSIGISETLMATAFSGMVFASLAGQPLLIVGSTGPLLLFDESLFQFCATNDVDYLTTRVYIGIWLAVIGLTVALFEGSVFVKLFTRFTAELFSALISLLYIVESVVKLFYVYGRHPLLQDYCGFPVYYDDINATTENSTIGNNDTMLMDSPDLTDSNTPVMMQRLPSFDATGAKINQPNTALFCTILALGTFAIAYYLRHFRNSRFLGRSARRALGDFGVPIAIVIMVFFDYMIPQTYTEKLSVPEGLSPSNPEKSGWIISPTGGDKPVPIWSIFAAVVPAMLVYILLFMETHISELIIDKKERKLKKGSGYHWDIVLVCLLNVGCGFIGAPWMCAATVRSVTHVSAVTVMSRTHAPGEKPHLIEVKEQRVSAFAVSALVGVSVLMAPLLRLVPMAVLFGIFLYMGVSSIDGVQFFDRIKLFFMPPKHHPEASYVKKVKTAKMHLFTFIQLMCLVILWVVKSTKASLAFPFFMLLMVPLRSQLKCMFSPSELRALDGDQPDAEDDEPDFYAEAPLPG